MVRKDAKKQKQIPTDDKQRTDNGKAEADSYGMTTKRTDNGKDGVGKDRVDDEHKLC
jgi:hypothetical protein